MGSGPCFNERHEVVGTAESALALLWDGRKVIGEIWVDNLVTKRSIDGGSLELLVRYARIVGSLSSLKRVQAELMLLASTDALTGVVNRRTVLVILEKQFSLAVAQRRRYLGHLLRPRRPQGGERRPGPRGRRRVHQDRQLPSSWARCATAIPWARIGSDEFLVVLPDCDAAGAAIIDARIEARPRPRPTPVSVNSR